MEGALVSRPARRRAETGGETGAINLQLVRDKMEKHPSCSKIKVAFFIMIICLLPACNKEQNQIKEAEPISSDKNVYKFTGDFDGNGFTDIAFWNYKDGAIWFGLYDGHSLNWIQVYENIEWEVVPRDQNIFKFTGNYVENGKIKTYFGFWYYGDGNIWIAKYNGKTLIWSVAGIKKY